MSRVRTPAQLRVPDALRPVKAASPEILAPFARAVHNAKCPVCGAMCLGVEDIIEGRPRIQVTCFGDPSHAFFFDAATGHISNQPDAYGEVIDRVAAP
jgi:hypothetical protein